MVDQVLGVGAGFSEEPREPRPHRLDGPVDSGLEILDGNVLVEDDAALERVRQGGTGFEESLDIGKNQAKTIKILANFLLFSSFR